MLKQLLYGLTFVMFAAMAVAACTELTASDDVSADSIDPIYNETVTSAGTQMATIAALQATAQNAQIMATQIGELSLQNQNLQGTIAAMSVVNGGQQPQYADAAQQAAVTGAQPMDQTSPNPPASTSGGTVATDPNLAAQTVEQINQQGQVVPTSTPHLINATPPPQVEILPQAEMPSPNGILYSQATTSSAVNNADGCAADTVSTFAPEVEEVYMTIVARNVIQGATFNVQWLRNSEIQFHSSETGWMADQDYDEICIWFSAVGPFESGNWTAEFVEDGQVVGSHDFYITGEEAIVEEGTMEPSEGS